VSDAGREFAELKREVIESRNQSIKTDNQIKNLSLDVKGFEKRFEILEKRSRFATLGTYGIVAVTVAWHRTLYPQLRLTGSARM
jgi:hypothetical protein